LVPPVLAMPPGIADSSEKAGGLEAELPCLGAGAGGLPLFALAGEPPGSSSTFTQDTPTEPQEGSTSEVRAAPTGILSHSPPSL